MQHWYNAQCCTAVAATPNDSSTVLSKLTCARGVMKQYEWDLSSSQPQGRVRGIHQQWLLHALRGPVNKDKIIAMTALIREDPVRCSSHIQQLIEIVNPAKKSHCQLAIKNLAKLFRDVLLPENRVLIPFERRPVETVTTHKADHETLRLWVFEEDLHNHYLRFIANLELVAVKDVVEQSRRYAIKKMFKLVKKQEGRERLMKALVNKLGDTSKKVSSSVVYQLAKLLREKPKLSDVVFHAVEDLLIRPNVNKIAQRNSIMLLASLLSNEMLAARQIKLLTHYFHHLLTENDQLAKSGKAKSEALKEENQRLLCTVLRAINKALPHIGDGTHLQGIEEHINNLFRLVYTAKMNVCVQTLTLLLQLVAYSVVSRDRFYQCFYRKLESPELRTTSKLGGFIRLFEDVLSKDDNSGRMKALCKRALQLCLVHPEPGVIVAFLLAIAKVASEKHILNITAKPVMAELENDDLDDSIANEDALMVSRKLAFRGKRKIGYDPHARNPCHAQADQELVWELTQLSRHVHPTVALFSRRILNGELFTYDGNPYTDFTVMHFLDRWVFKNPKKLETKKTDQKNNASAPPSVNSLQYVTQAEDKIPEHEKCFYRYFKQNLVASNNKEVESDSEVSDSEFEEYISKHNKELLGPDMDLDDEDIEFDFKGDPDLDNDSDLEYQAVDDSDEEEKDFDSDMDKGLFDSDEEMEVESD